jgi:hypothetical protein
VGLPDFRSARPFVSFSKFWQSRRPSALEPGLGVRLRINDGKKSLETGRPLCHRWRATTDGIRFSRCPERGSSVGTPPTHFRGGLAKELVLSYRANLYLPKRLYGYGRDERAISQRLAARTLWRDHHVKTLKTMFRPHRCLRALFALLILASSAPMARADVKWTLQDVVLSGFFGSVEVTGSFIQTGTGYSQSNITAVEFPGTSTQYTYTFTGRLNGPNYNNVPSQQPPTPCIIFGCSPGETFPPQPVTLNIDTILVENPPGPWSIVGSSFEDNEELFTGISGEVVGTTVPAPEPSFWVLASMAFAWLLALRVLRQPPSWISIFHSALRSSWPRDLGEQI